MGVLLKWEIDNIAGYYTLKRSTGNSYLQDINIKLLLLNFYYFLNTKKKNRIIENYIIKI